jgi:membrane fusion protein, macrolide-specific efflux system
MTHARRFSYLALLVLLALPIVGCSQGDDGETSDETSNYTVARGDLIVEVSASGNLAFSAEEELAFEMAGTVQDIFVSEGESVTEGMVVATLDTSDWEKQLRSYTLSLLSARLSLRQAESALEDAKTSARTSITGDVVVQDCCDDDQIELNEMQVEQAVLRLEDAQASLDEHLALSPQVVAPFDGFVTQVNVDGGDEVMKGTVAMTITDPNRFEVDILVSENDIAQLAEGMRAEVTVDVLSVTLPAEVSYIAPTATISSGVVNYQVTIEVATLEEYAAQLQEQMSSARQQMQTSREEVASGEMPEQLRQAIEAGDITEEEAAALLERTQSGAGPQSDAGTVQTPSVASILEGIALRDGLSVTVTLIVADKTDVLLVPNASISTAGGRASVTVIAADGTVEQRQVTTGVSNWQFTEITDGLAEGEIIETSGAVVDTSTFTQGGHPDNVVMMHGMGGPRG